MKRQNNSGTTRKMVLGAVMIAVFVVMYLAFPAGYMAFQTVMLIVTPIPIMIYKVNDQRLLSSILVVFAGAAVCALFLEIYVLLSFAIPSIVIGWVLGLVLERWGRYLAISILSILYFLQNVIEVVIFYYMLGTNALDGYIEMIKKAVEAAANVLKTDAYTDSLTKICMALLPVFLVFLSIAKAVVLHRIGLIVGEKSKSFIQGKK